MTSQIEKPLADETATEQRLVVMAKLLLGQIDSLRSEVAILKQQLTDLSDQLTTAQSNCAKTDEAL